MHLRILFLHLTQQMAQMYCDSVQKFIWQVTFLEIKAITMED